MPSSNELGLLRGLGRGMADIGKMGFAAELQRMRDDRLAKIADQAADKKWSRDKELVEMKIGADKDAADLRYQRDVDIAGISAKAKAAERNTWKLEKRKTKDEMGVESDVLLFVNEGTGQSIDTSTPFGGVVKRLTDQGVDIGTAISATASRFNQPGAGGGEGGEPDPNSAGNDVPAPPGRTPTADTGSEGAVDGQSLFAGSPRVQAFGGLLTRGVEAIKPHVERHRDYLNSLSRGQ